MDIKRYGDNYIITDVDPDTSNVEVSRKEWQAGTLSFTPYTKASGWTHSNIVVNEEGVCQIFNISDCRWKA